MNAVVLTAVLSCLNSGLYTASRMLFVLAARREAPIRLITVNGRGVPVWAILLSTVVGFLCVIAAYISPDTVFLFLLNSSGAIILFVYLIIAVSQYVLRRRTPEAKLQVKMWAFPFLTLLTIAAIVGVLISMGVGEDTRSQLVLSLVSLAVVVLVYLVVARRNRNVPAEASAAERLAAAAPHRVLIVANETVGADDLLSRDPAVRHGPRRGVLRLRAGQPGRHRPGRAQGRGVPLGGDPPGRAGAVGLHAGDPAQ